MHYTDPSHELTIVPRRASIMMLAVHLIVMQLVVCDTKGHDHKVY